MTADVTGDRIADLLLADPLGTAASHVVVVNGATGATVRDRFLFDPPFGADTFDNAR